MARRSNVPKFGEWENESNVPYTVYFDKARKNRDNEKQGIVNPNDPAQFQQLVSPKEPEKRGQRGPDPARPNQNRERSNGVARPEPEPEPRFPRDGAAKKRNEQSFEASPLHRNQNGRVAGTAGGPSHHQGVSGSNPGRTARPKQAIRSVHDSDDFSSAVPKFGDWEKNQESGEAYTEKFNKFIEDRKVGAVAPSPTSYKHRHGANKSPQKKKCFCFPWI